MVDGVGKMLRRDNIYGTPFRSELEHLPHPPVPGRRTLVEQAYPWVPAERSAAPEISNIDPRLLHKAANGCLRGGGDRRPIQAKLDNAGACDDTEAPELSDSVPTAGQSLLDPVRREMEAVFGADFSTVRIHEDIRATRLGARAFTRGEEIHFAPGNYDPTSLAGKALLGHELSHVLQQRSGRVRVDNDHAYPINLDPSLEAEADAHGERAARGEVTRAPQASLPPVHGRSAIQCALAKWSDIEANDGNRTGWGLQDQLEARVHSSPKRHLRRGEGSYGYSW